MQLELPIYLDNNATTPVDEQVLSVMLPYFREQYGNAASRSHVFGWAAADAVTLAREQVARLINAGPEEIIFTSGATESLNLAIKGVFEAYASKGKHMITCATEHNAVLDTCAHLEQKGASVTILPVDASGLIDLAALEQAITPQTILIAVMYANNETGVIQPIAEIGLLAKKHGVLFLSDATQAVGKIPVDVQADGIDLLSLSAHKLYGPKGIGALYIRRKNPRAVLTAQMDGGGHERGLRSGTLNVPGIAGLGKACAIAGALMETETTRLKTLRDRLETALCGLEMTQVNGTKAPRLPHVSNICFSFVDGGALMAYDKQIALSSGSACTSALNEPSHVLKAMGLTDEDTRSSLRFSLGRFTTEAQIGYVIAAMKKGVDILRRESPRWQLFREDNKINKPGMAGINIH